MWKALGLLLLLVVSSAAAQEPRIENLSVSGQNGRILVSFELLDALDDDMLERVQSGLPTEARASPFGSSTRGCWWFNRVIERSNLQVVAMYNAVTREYLVNYKLDGRLIESRVVG